MNRAANVIMPAESHAERWIRTSSASATARPRRLSATRLASERAGWPACPRPIASMRIPLADLMARYVCRAGRCPLCTMPWLPPNATPGRPNRRLILEPRMPSLTDRPNAWSACWVHEECCAKEALLQAEWLRSSGSPAAPVPPPAPRLCRCCWTARPPSGRPGERSVKQMEVTILGQKVTCWAARDGGEAHALRQAVAQVDREMHAIRDAGESRRVSASPMLVALNLAYQLAEVPAHRRSMRRTRWRDGLVGVWTKCGSRRPTALNPAQP